MAFQLDPKPDDVFYERKQHAHTSSERTEDVHKDLFETISEAHYLPELGGPHDEALLESLVEKGCEDNQILGQALDKLAHLVTDYEEEDDMLLGAAPVSDIINRLEQSLESPGRSSMTAAQSLLHLHQLTDHLPPQSDHNQHTEAQSYLPEDLFAPQANQSTVQPMHNSPETCSQTELNHMQYEQNSEVRPEDNHVYDQNTEASLEGPHGQYNQSSEGAHPQCDENAKSSLEEVPNVQYEKNAKSSLENASVENTEAIYSNISEEVASNVDNSYNKKFEEQTSLEPAPPQVEDATDIEDPSQETETANCDTENVEIKTEMDTDPEEVMDTVDDKDDDANGVELVATDLSMKSKHMEKRKTPLVIASVVETTNSVVDSVSEKTSDFPRDLSGHRRLPTTPHASPRRTELPRAPSRESDAMQSPQPSGIPAIPSSPEIFTMPLTKSKQTLFLESLLSSPSPKMYTSEVTITKQNCEPMSLGKHRKSASPTVSSCSDEIRKQAKDYGEPQEKRIKHESSDDLAKISKVLNKCIDEQISDSTKQKKSERSEKPSDDLSPLKQLQMLRTNPDLNIPDPLLIPRSRIPQILAAPGIEIPALLTQRPELRLPEAFQFPSLLRDPEILILSLSHVEKLLDNDTKKQPASKAKESKTATKTSSSTEQTSTFQADASQPKSVPSMDALAGDIDAATTAALNQMLWLPYLSQLEAMAACSQNMDFLKALNTSGYGGVGPNYSDASQMFNPNSARGFMGPSGFPMMPSMDYDNRLQFAMWQEAMNHANTTAAAQRAKPSPLEAQMKELAKSSDVQNPYVHSTKSHQSKSHSAARTSPITHNYNTNQRAMPHNPYLQSMYPGMTPNMRPNMPPNMPLPGLQIPYFNPNLMSQRSPRTPQQKSPTSPYYPNNNYLQSKPDGHPQRRSSTSSQESPRPRISVKSLQNLLEPSASAVGGSRRHSHGSNHSHQQMSSALGRRRDEPEVGSTTPLGEQPVPMPPHHMPPMPPHPHDPASFHLWHPLFGNQKSYASPWSWTTVTATGD